jgi:hypothetical protein
MVKKKFPKDFKARKKLEKCLADDGWTNLDIDLLLGYSVKLPETLTSFQNMVYYDEPTRKMMVKSYLEKYDIRAEISK